jgi:hypothetical protein
MRITIVLIVVLYLCTPSVVFAHNPYDIAIAPPQLDNEQANWWRCSSPNMRQYLARLYNVPEEVARNYGAHYDNEDKVFSLNNQETLTAGLGMIAGFSDQLVTVISRYYKAPPGFPDVQAATWANADPGYKVHLAEIYKIPRDVAELYGARY